jgi:hypothetical protein
LALAEDNAGNSIAARMAITAITTSNSTKVNALLRAICDLIWLTLQTLLNGRHPLPKEHSYPKQAKTNPARGQYSSIESPFTPMLSPLWQNPSIER